MSFLQVQTNLNKALAGWKTANGGADPDLSGHQVAGKPPMSWASAAELRAAWGKNVQLIQPEVVGNGKGAQANLVIDLKTGQGGRPRMPRGGPYLSDVEIQQIVDWIDAGALDDPPAGA